MDRAVLDVDDGFAQSFELRRRHREVCYLSSQIKATHSSYFLQQRPGQPFWDPSVPHIPFVSGLPDPLRLKPSGVQPQQAAVYEDFGMCSYIYEVSCMLTLELGMDPKRRMGTSRPASTASYGRNDRLGSIYASSPAPEVPLPGSHMLLGHQEAMEQFNVRLTHATNADIFTDPSLPGFYDQSREHSNTASYQLVGGPSS